MGPSEFNEIGDRVNELRDTLNLFLGDSLDYDDPKTSTFRTNIAELRSKSNELVSKFPRESFPLANKALKRFANKMELVVRDFPGKVIQQKVYSEELKNIWFLEVRPSIYALEIALAVTGGIYLPEDPSLYIGKDRLLRDIAFEVNVCYRNGAYNACSVMLRRLVESLIIKVYQKKGIIANAQNAQGQFYKLEKLIDDLVASNTFGLTRNAIGALPELKRLGDWGAHNRNIVVRLSDLEPQKANARVCIEELIRLT